MVYKSPKKKSKQTPVLRKSVASKARQSSSSRSQPSKRRRDLESSPVSKFTLSEGEFSSSIGFPSPVENEPAEYNYALRRRSAPACYQKDAKSSQAGEGDQRRLRERRNPVCYTLEADFNSFWTDGDYHKYEEHQNGGSIRKNPIRKGENDDFWASSSDIQDRRMTRSASQLATGGNYIFFEFCTLAAIN